MRKKKQKKKPSTVAETIADDILKYIRSIATSVLIIIRNRDGLEKDGHKKTIGRNVAEIEAGRCVDGH